MTKDSARILTGNSLESYPALLNRIDKIDEDRKKASRARGLRATFMPKGQMRLFAPKLLIFAV
jgi:hypothetical protein